MKAAVIGLGGQGLRALAAIRSLPRLELVAAADRRQEALDRAELPESVMSCLDAAEIFSRGDVELVCITTNGPSHAQLANAAMEAGIDRVMVEKPMACSVADCERMMEAAQKTGTRLSVNQSRRHDPFYAWLRERIADGDWGEPRCVWIQRPGIGLGCLGTHYFDLVRDLTAKEVRRVTAWVDDFIGPNPRGAEFIDPGGLVVMELEDRVRGVVAQIEDGAGPMSVEINLTAARVRIDEKLDSIEVVERDLSVVPRPGVGAKYHMADVPQRLSARTDVTKMVRGVIEELAGDEPLACAAEHGAMSVQVLVAAHLSERRGNTPVGVPISSKEDRELCLPVT